jgi:hypothetical protein
MLMGKVLVVYPRSVPYSICYGPPKVRNDYSTPDIRL